MPVEEPMAGLQQLFKILDHFTLVRIGLRWNGIPQSAQQPAVDNLWLYLLPQWHKDSTSRRMCYDRASRNNRSSIV